MAVAAKRLERAARVALTKEKLLRLVRFPAIRRAISSGLARQMPVAVDIPRGGRFIRFRLKDPRRFHSALFSTITLGSRGTKAVIGTPLSSIVKRAEFASFLRRMGGRLRGPGHKSMVYQLRKAGIIGPSVLQSILVPRSRVEHAVARFAASPAARRVSGNPILATLGLNPAISRIVRGGMTVTPTPHPVTIWPRGKRKLFARIEGPRRGIRRQQVRSVSAADTMAELAHTRRNSEGHMVFEGPEQTSAYRMLALKGALKLELLGMRRSRGPSALSIVKREFGLKGSKQQVFDQFAKMVQDVVEHRAKPPGFNRGRRGRNPLTRREVGRLKREARSASAKAPWFVKHGPEAQARYYYGAADATKSIARRYAGNPLPGVTKWHMYAGGTAAAEGKHSYAIYTADGEYHIWPISSKYGRHIGYLLYFVNSKGKLRGGLWQQLGPRGRPEITGTRGRLHRSPQAAATAASTHHTLHFGAGAKLNGKKCCNNPRPHSHRRARVAARKNGLTYAEWMKQVDLAVQQRAGLSLHDLPDVPLADWYEDGVSPRSAAARAIRSANENPRRHFAVVKKQGRQTPGVVLETTKRKPAERYAAHLRRRWRAKAGVAPLTNPGTQTINIPFRDGQRITPAQMRAWLNSLPNGDVKRNIVRRFVQGIKQYKRFHLGAEPRDFTYRAVQMGSAGKRITDVDVVVSEGKEWAATYQVPPHSRKYDGKGTDGRFIHAHGDSTMDVDIKRVASKHLLPERFHTADGKFVGVVPTRNVKITDWYRG